MIESSSKTSSTLNFDAYIDRLIIHFTSDAWRAEVANAKKEFFQDAGIMDEQSHHFEIRMTQFLDWYLFTRRLAGRKVTPAQFALEIDNFEMTAHERTSFENLSEIKHSLFEFLKLRGRDIHVRDLFLDKEIVIRESPVNIGFSRDEFFDARLIPSDGDFVFARSFCFHPIEAREFIAGEIKKIQDSLETEDLSEYEAFMLRLMKMRYKYEQFRHLKLDYVYTNEKKVRF